MISNLKFEDFNNHSSLVDKVVYLLEKEIIEGRLKPRERLIETELSDALKISRSPIREALRVLERDGLVTISPRKGITVSDITDRDIEDVYTIRAVLEGLAARLSTKNFTEKDIATLENIYDKMEKAAQKRDLNDYFQLIQEFQEKMLKATFNERLIRILENLRKQILRFRFFALSFPGQVNNSLLNHRKLLDAFKSRDGELAGRIRFEVVEKTGLFIKEKISRNKIQLGISENKISLEN